MPKRSTTRPTAPETVWLASGHHTGPDPEETLRDNLRKLKADETIQDFLEPGTSSESDEHVFEARWHVAEAVTVRARLTTGGRERPDQEPRWTLAAEAERPWDPAWPSPATMFWPETSTVSWDHDVVVGLRPQDINPLPQDDAALRRLLRDAARHSWSINVVVHEAMTPDERGLLPLARLLPPGLRHRVVEHRASPEQFRAVNWALYDLGVRVPRGGAVILPGTPARIGYEAQDFTVRSVFLDGSEPTELLDKVVRFAALPWPLAEDAEKALTALRQDWHLVTLEEELAHARALLDSYAEALDAMTKSRDRYREATELAHVALAEMKELRLATPAASETSHGQHERPANTLTTAIQRLTGPLRARRTSGDEAGDQGTPGPEGDTRESGTGR
ncbi:hypothetical protein [Streptomyces sp. NPDC093544]|jgi:hypothetical protein|uniref:hypothetical protein n=1 Tax=Streptomyces sp. NPDC093544 TaxID=3155200 RepID=UPI00343FD7DC